MKHESVESASVQSCLVQSYLLFEHIFCQLQSPIALAINIVCPHEIINVVFKLIIKCLVIRVVYELFVMKTLNIEQVP